MIVALTDGGYIAIGGIFVAAIAAVPATLSAYWSRQTRDTGREVRDEVTANGGTTNTSGDRLLRVEQGIAALSRAHVSLDARLEVVQEENRIAFTDALVQAELVHRRLQDRDHEIATRLDSAVARLDAMTTGEHPATPKETP